MEQILPGVSVEVRPEGLIIPGQISIGTIGIVGTASRGAVNSPVIIGTAAEARQRFGNADAFDDGNAGSELTLVRAIDVAYDHGAQDVIAVRVANGAITANFLLESASGACCTLAAATPGSWANELTVNVTSASEPALVADEQHAGAATVGLDHNNLIESVRTRVEILPDGSTVPIVPEIVYDVVPAAGQVSVDTAAGDLDFADTPAATDTVTATYVVNAANSVDVTLKHDTGQETFTVASGAHLVDLVNDGSDLANGTNGANSAELPDTFTDAQDFRAFGSSANTSGTNGVSGAIYGDGLDTLLNEPAHIIVCAGQDQATLAADLTAHVTTASSDENKRERIGIVGSTFIGTTSADQALTDVLEHTVNSDRMLFVSPGINVTDSATGQGVTLGGEYSAAAIAGMLSGRKSHISLTNKRLAVRDLERRYTNAELRRLVQARVLALEIKLGFRVVKGITTSTNTAWHQITTRRIVDEAKFGVRSAANPYIGLLNNERVRAALRSTVNSFLTGMVEDEKLVSYELDVTATREEERRGIARVTIVLRPTFSIDFIKVTMFLE